MQNKKSMNTAVAAVICLLFVGALIFISLKTEPKMNTTSGGSNVAGEELIAKEGDMVAMSYTGRLSDGTVFDSNLDPKFGHVQPFIFTLGEGRVIPGWEKGIVGMKVGEKKTLVVPPEDAYRETGVPGVIPPNATLTFEVELLAINSDAR